MNYDEFIVANMLPSGRVREEENCAPHPFDTMAIHALYQGVD